MNLNLNEIKIDFQVNLEKAKTEENCKEDQEAIDKINKASITPKINVFYKNLTCLVQG